MLECPRCHQAVDGRAIICPHCQASLKAYGHPGIPLHRATGQEPLCATCIYDADDSCTFPQRPFARECTLYSDRTQQKVTSSGYSRSFLVKTWFRRNAVWLALLGLILLSVVVVLFQ
jgi:hypothetical protein